VWKVLSLESLYVCGGCNCGGRRCVDCGVVVRVHCGLDQAHNLTEWQDDEQDRVGAENCSKQCVYCVFEYKRIN